MNPIYCAYYTKDSRYETEIRNLVATLLKWKLDHHIEAIDSLGKPGMTPTEVWAANTRYTPTFIRRMMERFPDRPVVSIDADAVVWKYPKLFDELGDSVDVGVRYSNGQLLGNGTAYFAPTEGARAVVQRYEDLIRDNPDCRNEQIMLQRAIEELKPRFENIPASYLYIADINPDAVVPDDVVIAHHQASREMHPGEALDRRRGWLAEFDKRFAAHAVS